MTTPINLDMPGKDWDDAQEAPRFSGEASTKGPRRKIDTGARRNNRKLSVNISDQLYDEVRIAASLSKMSVQEFVLRLVIPEIKRVYQSRGLESEL